MTLKKLFFRGVKEEAGFSLVELSMALLVIGLIVGGILKGQDLLESARLRSVRSQVDGYRLAVRLFLDRYGALPGDYAEAAEHIDTSLHNGKGNEKIEGQGLEQTGPGHEALSFWAHLAAAGLIASPGKVSSASGGMGQFGQGAPKAKIGGGFTVRYNVFGEGHHWFVLGEAHGSSGEGAGLTPLQAMSIDQQGDSGRPREGRIRAREGKNVATGSCVTAQGTYNSTRKGKACVMYFQF